MRSWGLGVREIRGIGGFREIREFREIRGFREIGEFGEETWLAFNLLNLPKLTPNSNNTKSREITHPRTPVIALFCYFVILCASERCVVVPCRHALLGFYLGKHIAYPLP